MTYSNLTNDGIPLIADLGVLMLKTPDCNDGGYIAINPKLDKLITSLRTAVENDGVLDKETTSYDDVFDAFRLALCFLDLVSQY